jgi:hypothetical protein
MVAGGPDGFSIDVPLTPRVSDTAYWDGTVVFTTPGQWVLRVIYPRWADEECGGARTSVTVLAPVLPKTEASSGLGTLVAGLAAAATICGAAVSVFVHRKTRHGRSSGR